MQQHEPVSDDAPARLNALAARLRERLVEARDIRTRFTKALDANVWPDLRALSRLFTDNDPRAH